MDESNSEFVESGEETRSGGGSRVNDSEKSGCRYWASATVDGGDVGDAKWQAPGFGGSHSLVRGRGREASGWMGARG